MPGATSSRYKGMLFSPSAPASCWLKTNRPDMSNTRNTKSSRPGSSNTKVASPSVGLGYKVSLSISPDDSNPSELSGTTIPEPEQPPGAATTVTVDTQVA